MNIHPSLCILFRAKARIECATCEAKSACQLIKLAHVFDFRVQRAKHPRAFEHLLIKERRKPRFTKDWRTFYFASATCEASSHNGNSACQFLKLAHVFDFRVQRAKHPRTKQKVRVSS